MPTLLTIPLRTKRDLLVARQRARQVAALLRFDFSEQACIAAGAFAVAAEALRGACPRRLSFQLENSCLCISPVTVSGNRLSISAERAKRRDSRAKISQLVKLLPESAPPLASDDLQWVLRELSKRMPVSAFEEIERQNQEVLALVHALRQAQSQAAQPDFRVVAPSAA